MSAALDTILDYKRDEVAALKQRVTRADLQAMADDQPPARGFEAALTAVVERGQNALICELKRKSPSAGEILPGADPADIARQYQDGGAACLSVLTDGPSFGGSLADFAAIRAAVSIPMLRKDFMIDPIQVVEARAHGADCILVILSALDDSQAGELTDLANTLGMDVLVETHDADEVRRARQLASRLVGINNRDLKRMVTDLETTTRLAPLLPGGVSLVSESGISTPDHICRLRTTGARRFLIGESLMKRPDRKTHVKALREAGTG